MSKSPIPPSVKRALEETPAWVDLLPADPRGFLLTAGETFTEYRTLTELLDLPREDPAVRAARERLTADPQIQDLIARLSDWEHDVVTAHNKPTYLPNQLWLLLDMGLTPESVPAIKTALDRMLAHQDPASKQFLAYSRGWKQKENVWTSVLCDHNLIMAVLLRAGLGEDPRVQAGLSRMTSLLKETTQGFGWKCEPGIDTNFRGPGRKDDVCPMAVVDALRAYRFVSPEQHPEQLIAAGETLLGCWTNRASHKPYMFGHGKNFRGPRPPFFWYNIGTVLEVTCHYPTLVRMPAFAELLAVSQLAFNDKGTIIPTSIKLDFRGFSFGQKKTASPWVTLFFCRIFKQAVDIRPDLVQKVNSLDGSRFKGSIGGPKPKK